MIVTQYRIFCDDYVLYDSQLNEFQLGNPVLKQELNMVDELTFTIYPNHPYFNNISKLSSEIKVFRDDNLLFKGRVINSELGFRNEKKIVCEGVLAFLLDTIIRPFDFPNDEQFSDFNPDENNAIEYFLNWILNCHNSQAKDFQKIQLGNVTVTDPNNYLSRSSIEYLSSWEVINSRLLKSYGGYLVIREENGVNYLDYLEDFTSNGTKNGNKLVCTQKIEFGANLIDLTEEISGADIKTGIIPLGARLEDESGNQTDKYLTIESLPDCELSPGIIKTGDHILNTNLAKNYGVIYEVVKWEDVRVPENLQSKALSYLADSIKFKSEITIKAVDLKLTNDQISAFKVGEYIRCQSSPHGIDDLYLLQKISIDMKNPQNTVIELNKSSLTFTDKVLENKKNADNIINRVDRVERGYLNSGSVIDIANETIEKSSAFEQQSSAIMSQVSELYTKSTDFETYKSNVATQFVQTSEDFTYQFSNLTELINNLNSNSAEQFNNIIRYIRFLNGDIILGEINNSLMLKISNDKISFLQNGIEVAYMTDNKLYITDGEFLNSLQLGNFAFYPRSNGNLSFKKIK
ncbi:MAG: phage tail protein [Clostridia bacterium]|nr:phage tail protein [Clostridia bacterium]